MPGHFLACSAKCPGTFAGTEGIPSSQLTVHLPWSSPSPPVTPAAAPSQSEHCPSLSTVGVDPEGPGRDWGGGAAASRDQASLGTKTSDLFQAMLLREINYFQQCLFPNPHRFCLCFPSFLSQWVIAGDGRNSPCMNPPPQSPAAAPWPAGRCQAPLAPRRGKGTV